MTEAEKIQTAVSELFSEMLTDPRTAEAMEELVLIINPKATFPKRRLRYGAALNAALIGRLTGVV